MTTAKTTGPVALLAAGLLVASMGTVALTSAAVETPSAVQTPSALPTLPTPPALPTPSAESPSFAPVGATAAPLGQSTTQPDIFKAPGEDQAKTGFDKMQRWYKPLCQPEAEGLGWAMKVRAAMSGGELKFATSTRELFFDWAVSACADWRSETGALGAGGAYVQCHGDVHFGNVGSYVADLTSGALAVGLIDFDETVAMPFQMDLLQAAVTLRLQASHDGLSVDEAMAARGVRALLAGYREAMDSGLSATEILAGDGRVAKLLDVDARKTPRDAAEPWVEGGKFRRVIRGKKGEVKDILRPALTENDPTARYSREALAAAISRATEVSPTLKKAVAFRTTVEWERAIEDAAIRTRVGSGGSQGLLKVLVYVKAAVITPGGTSDAVIYLKEQSTSAAQRAGFASVDAAPASGGRRVSGGMSVLTRPAADGIAWCDIVDRTGTHSFLVDVMTPWTDEIKVKITDGDEMDWAARYLGVCIGAAHTNATGGVGAARRLRERAGAGLEPVLVTRSQEFMKLNAATLHEWVADPRVTDLRNRAEAAIASRH